MDGPDQKDEKPPAQPMGVGRGGEPQPDAAFDVWLRRNLHQMYDSIAAEPVPPELLRLIEDDRARRRG